jgi:pentatricopeptide repeat protein
MPPRYKSLQRLFRSLTTATSRKNIALQDLEFFSNAQKQSVELDLVKELRWKLFSNPTISNLEIKNYSETIGLESLILKLMELNKSQTSLALVERILNCTDIDELSKPTLLSIAKYSISNKGLYKRIYLTLQKRYSLEEEELIALLKLHNSRKDYDGTLFLYQLFSSVQLGGGAFRILVGSIVHHLAPNKLIEVFNDMIKSEVAVDLQLLRTMMEALIERGSEQDLAESIESLDMKEASSYFHTIILRRRLKRGQRIAFESVMNQLENLPYQDVSNYIDIMDGYASTGQHYFSKELYSVFLQKGFASNLVLEACIVGAITRKTGNATEAIQFLEKNLQLSTSVYNRVIGALLSIKDFSSAWNMYHLMRSRGKKPSSVLLYDFLEFFEKVQDVDGGIQLLQEFLVDGGVADFHLFKKLARMVKNHPKATEIWQQFDNFVSYDPNTSNRILFPEEYLELKVDYLFDMKSSKLCEDFLDSLSINTPSRYIAYAVLQYKLGKPRSVFNTLYAMERAGFAPSAFSTLLWMKSCKHESKIDTMELILRKMAKQRLPLTPAHVGLLVPVFCRAKQYAKAIKIVQFLESLGYNVTKFRNLIKVYMRKSDRRQFDEFYTHTNESMSEELWFQAVYPIHYPNLLLSLISKLKE